MRNKIFVVSQSEFIKIKEELQLERDLYIVEIQGKACITRGDFFENISKTLKFPIPSKNFNGYDDWMRDLSWIPEHKIAFVVHDYNMFLKNDLETKKNFITGFTDIILPWWASEVLYHAVNEETRQFDVYLVTDFEKEFTS